MFVFVWKHPLPFWEIHLLRFMTCLLRLYRLLLPAVYYIFVRAGKLGLPYLYIIPWCCRERSQVLIQSSVQLGQFSSAECVLLNLVDICNPPSTCVCKAHVWYITVAQGAKVPSVQCVGTSWLCLYVSGMTCVSSRGLSCSFVWEVGMRRGRLVIGHALSLWLRERSRQSVCQHSVSNCLHQIAPVFTQLGTEER